LTTSVDAKIIALVYDCTQEENYLAPGFASMFNKEVIGIITKIAIAKQSDIDFAIEQLNMAGASKIFKVDTIEDIGIEELRSYLMNIK